MKNNHIKFMRVALKEAIKGYKKDEVPVGAVIVKDGKILSKAYSQVRKLKDPTAHAEILAIKKACKNLKNERLLDMTVYVTLEPCAMCAGALVLARIKRLVYGVDEPKTGAIKSVFKIGDNKRLNHMFEVKTGILSLECSRLLKHFFKNKRR
ncbi:MAG: tRNA adenosine(34) deaminase TadA [Candidatus Firestonebacteria bacterium]